MLTATGQPSRETLEISEFFRTVANLRIHGRAPLDRLGIVRERRDRGAIMGGQSTAEIEDLETDAAMNYVEQAIGAA